MKRILSFFIICMIVAGCNEDFLDRAPLDALSDASFWTTQKDAEAALNGCYMNWADGRNDAFYMDCASDNAYFQFANNDMFMMLGNGKATATNTGYVVWNYKTIRKCNVFLKNIDRVEMDAKLKKRYKAEARFLRVYRYFLIHRAYRSAPLVTEPLPLAEANAVGKETDAGLRKFILDELNEIGNSDDLEVSYTGTDVGRITKGAALGLKARFELFEGMYDECVKTCEAIFALGKYQLFPDYIDLFRIQNENNVEVMLDIQYMPDYYTYLLTNALAPNSAGGYSAVCVLQSLVDAYECMDGKTIDDPTASYDPENPYLNRDPRLEATIIHPGTHYGKVYYDPITPGSVDYYTANNCSKSGFLCKKYIYDMNDFGGDKNVHLNMIMMRYAEMLLTYAEAKIELNSIDQSVLDAINRVRARAYGVAPAETGQYPAVTTTSQTELRKIIRRERRVELAMEGLRWYDIQRWRIGKETLNGTAYGTRLGTVNSQTGEVKYSPTERIVVEQRVFDENKNYLWPIPQSELDVNPNLKPNNPGY